MYDKYEVVIDSSSLHMNIDGHMQTNTIFKRGFYNYREISETCYTQSSECPASPWNFIDFPITEIIHKI